MKLNEIIELNGKEYTVELNRESIVRIEQYINLKKAAITLMQKPYEDKSEREIDKDENPFADEINEDKYEELSETQEQVAIKMYTKAFWIWLYPVEKLNYDEVYEILKPYIEDEEKSSYLSDKYQEFMKKSIDLREKYKDERKNLKALAN